MDGLPSESKEGERISLDETVARVCYWYGFTVKEAFSHTRQQILYLLEQAQEIKLEELEFEAAIHGADTKKRPGMRPAPDGAPRKGRDKAYSDLDGDLGELTANLQRFFGGGHFAVIQKKGGE